MQDFTLQPNMAQACERRRRVNPAFWWFLLIAGGLLLLQTTGYLNNVSDLLISMAFALGGLTLFYFFLRAPACSWWAAIPGSVFLGVASTIFLDAVAPSWLGWLAAPSMLAFMGTGFAIVYLSGRYRWWAIFPAGLFYSVALTVAASGSGGAASEAAGGLMVMGLGATFALVALSGRAENTRRWAYIPAAILGTIGFLIYVGIAGGSATLFSVWPAALVVVGGWFAYVALSRR